MPGFKPLNRPPRRISPHSMSLSAHGSRSAMKHESIGRTILFDRTLGFTGAASGRPPGLLRDLRPVGRAVQITRVDQICPVCAEKLPHFRSMEERTDSVLDWDPLPSVGVSKT